MSTPTTPEAIQRLGIQILEQAEGIGSPEGADYIALMEFIRQEASDRADLMSSGLKHEHLQARYLTNPGKCPYCQSTDITGDSIEVDGDGASQHISCSHCHEQWIDTYELTGFQPA